jgi:hypothetical protein
MQSDAAWRAVAKGEQVPQRDQVDVVVAVHVADRDGIDRGWISLREEGTQGSLTEVEHQAVTVRLQQVRRRWLTQSL